MNFSDYGTYVGVLGFLTFCIATLDVVFTARVKDRVANAIRYCFRLAEDTKSARFYFFVLAFSVIMTVLVVALVGGIGALHDLTDPWGVALKSTGPLILALVLKVSVWDYCMAQKSSFLMRCISPETVGLGKRIDWTRGIIIGLDLLISTVVTGLFIHTIENFQVEAGKSNSGIGRIIPPSVREFFDELNLFAKYAVQVSVYLLNGASIFYIGSAITWISHPSKDVLNWANIRKFPFTTIACILGLLCFVIVSSAYFAAKH
jgi:hypothetical protein